MQNDEINHPPHYTSHESGIECIDIVRYLPYSLGNAVKYLWRAGLKTEDKTKDLRKAVWYIQDYIDNDKMFYLFEKNCLLQPIISEFISNTKKFAALKVFLELINQEIYVNKDFDKFLNELEMIKNSLFIFLNLIYKENNLAINETVNS